MQDVTKLSKEQLLQLVGEQDAKLATQDAKLATQDAKLATQTKDVATRGANSRTPRTIQPIGESG